jgi:copper chaperone NosL
MKRLFALAIAIAGLALPGCEPDRAAVVPQPNDLNADAVAHYCGMSLLEHPGPKGQIILASRIDPVWFASARDAIAFTLLPEEPKDVQAIYVSDMGKAPSWDAPGASNWVNAKKAWFVISSAVRSAMGAEEAVPFSDRTLADRFAAERGGRVVGFSEVPRDYVLGGDGTTDSSQPQATKS